MQTVELPSCFGGRCTKANFLFSPTWHGLSLQFQQRAPSQRESSVWLGTLWLLRGPAWRHPRWSSWSPLRPTLGCFDSMEARSRFVLKRGVLNFDNKIYMILYQQLPEIYLIWSISQWIWFLLLLGMIYIAKVSHFHFLDIGILGKRRSICTTRYSAE